jgi:hypothetical protein
MPQYDVRADKWEIAQNAMDRVNRERIAKGKLDEMTKPTQEVQLMLKKYEREDWELEQDQAFSKMLEELLFRFLSSRLVHWLELSVLLPVVPVMLLATPLAALLSLARLLHRVPDLNFLTLRLAVPDLVLRLSSALPGFRSLCSQTSPWRTVAIVLLPPCSIGSAAAFFGLRLHFVVHTSLARIPSVVAGVLFEVFYPLRCLLLPL